MKNGKNSLSQIKTEQNKKYQIKLEERTIWTSLNNLIFEVTMFYRKPTNELSLSQTFDMLNPFLDDVRGIPVRGSSKNSSEMHRPIPSPHDPMIPRRHETTHGGIPRPQQEARQLRPQNRDNPSDVFSHQTAKFKESMPFDSAPAEIESNVESVYQGTQVMNHHIENESQKTVDYESIGSFCLFDTWSRNFQSERT
jgi:hypothetical protein